MHLIHFRLARSILASQKKAFSMTYRKNAWFFKRQFSQPLNIYKYTLDPWCYYESDYASVNSSCAETPSPPPRGWPPGISIFLHWMAKSRGRGLLSCQIPRCGDKKRGRIPCPPSTLQHFSLIAQSNSAVLSILMSDLFFQLTSSFVIALGF